MNNNRQDCNIWAEDINLALRLSGVELVGGGRARTNEIIHVSRFC